MPVFVRIKTLDCVATTHYNDPVVTTHLYDYAINCLIKVSARLTVRVLKYFEQEKEVN